MDIMNEKEMAEPFALSMLPGETKDTLIDYAEIGLDAVGNLFLDGPGYDLLKEFPILRTIGAVGKMGKSIRERHQMKKLLAFLQAVKEGNADQKEIERRIQAARKGEKWFIREVEEVFVYLDRQTSAYKSKIFGRIYIDCMSGVISYDQRCEYYEILDQLFLCDIEQLTELYYFEQEKMDAEQELNNCKKRLKPGEIGVHAVGYGVAFERAKCLRLVSLGLLENGTVFPKSNADKSDTALTAQGRYFANLLLKMGYQTLSKRIMDHGIV